MENVGRLEENLDVLSAEMSVLKHLRDDVARRGERRMERWLQNVEAREHEVHELRKELYGVRKGSKPRLELHTKVIESLRAVADLKREGNYNVVANKVGAVAIIEGTDLQRYGDGSSETIERFLSQMEREKPLRFSSRQLRRFTSEFISHLGNGAYGEVYKGKFPNGVQLAVKVLKNNARDVVKRQFMAEVSTMGRTYHRNLVRLYGYCFDDNLKALVYEYVENGSLDKILYDNHLNIEWGKLYHIAIETAKGLSYLHENCHKRIIHCDIKAGNVLIDTNLCPKVADFGLAKLCNRDLSHVTLTGFRGTPGYAAPEVWMPLPVTYKCDVYSFGMLLFEVLGRKKNWNSNLGDGQKWFPKQVWEKVEKGQFEEIMSDCGIEEKERENAKTLCMVALWCAQYEPQVRPSMSTVVKILEGEIPAMVPPNPFPHLVTSDVASMVTFGISETMSSLVSSKLSITSNGDSTITGGPTTPLLMPSPTISDRQAELQSPFQKSITEVEKKNEDNKGFKHEEKKEEVITVVLMVYMHCEACAHEIKKYLMKMKGVQTAAADLNRSQVTVKGVLDPEKLVEFIYKKTNKRAMIVKTELEKKEEVKAIATTGQKKQEQKAVTETKLDKKKEDKKPNKLPITVKVESEKTEEENAVAKIEASKKQEEKVVAKTILESKKEEKKPNKSVITPKPESEKAEEESIAKTEPKKKQEVKGEMKTRSEKKKEEKNEGGQIKWEKKEQELGIVKTRPDKKKEGEGATETKPGEKKDEEASAETKLVEEKGMVRREAERKDAEKIKEVKGFLNIVPNKKKGEKGNENTVDKKARENIGVEKKNVNEAKPEKQKPMEEEEGTKAGKERNKNEVFQGPPKYRRGTMVWTDQTKNRFDQDPPTYTYPQETLFSDDNPNGCSIQ